MSGILIDATAADTEGSLGGDVPFDTSFEIESYSKSPAEGICLIAFCGRLLSGEKTEPVSAVEHIKNGRLKLKKLQKIFSKIFDIFRPDCILSITGQNYTESYRSVGSDILYYKTERRHNLCQTKI